MTSIDLHTLESPFEQLCQRILADMKRLKVPGAALAVWHEDREFSAGFGKTSLENPLRVTPDTLFQVGSISKTFTGTILMKLAEDGLLDLDMPVRKYLPKFKMADKDVEKHVTTRHLLTHTGGWLGDYFNDFGNGDDALKKMVKSLRKLEQVTPLGKIWSYNNAGFNIAGRLIEVLTDLPYETAAQRMILDPLGMDMTFFYPSDILFTHRFVVGHARDGKKVQVARPWAIGRAGNAVGGVVSTVRDLMKYARFQMGDGKTASGGQMISSESLKAMRVPQVDAGGFSQMGITWFIRQAGQMSVFGHGGATKGQEAGFHFIPEKNFALAILTNSDDGATITDSVLKWALELYFNAALPAPAPLEMSAEALAEYVGIYDLPGAAALPGCDFRLENGGLVLHDIPRGGFPTPETPPGPAGPPMRASFYEKDKIMLLDEPSKGAMGDFFRDEAGKIAFLRLGGRVRPRVS